MNNLIQLLIAVILSSIGIAEEVNHTSITGETENNLAITLTSVNHFIPTAENECSESEIYFFSHFQ